MAEAPKYILAEFKNVKGQRYQLVVHRSWLDESNSGIFMPPRKSSDSATKEYWRKCLLRDDTPKRSWERHSLLKIVNEHDDIDAVVEVRNAHDDEDDFTDDSFVQETQKRKKTRVQNNSSQVKMTKASSTPIKRKGVRTGMKGTNRVDITEEMVKSSLKHDGSAQPNSKNNKIVDSDTICEESNFESGPRHIPNKLNEAQFLTPPPSEGRYFSKQVSYTPEKTRPARPPPSDSRESPIREHKNRPTVETKLSSNMRHQLPLGSSCDDNVMHQPLGSSRDVTVMQPNNDQENVLNISDQGSDTEMVSDTEGGSMSSYDDDTTSGQKQKAVGSCVNDIFNFTDDDDEVETAGQRLSREKSIYTFSGQRLSREKSVRPVHPKTQEGNTPTFVHRKSSELQQQNKFAGSSKGPKLDDGDHRKLYRTVTKTFAMVREMHNTLLQRLPVLAEYPDISACDDMNTFKIVDNALKTDSRERQKYEMVLRACGGKDYKQCTKNCMNRVMTNRLMAGMNLKGKGGKVAYKSMEMYKLIQECVLRMYPNGATEDLIKVVVADYLRFAPERIGGGGRHRRTVDAIDDIDGVSPSPPL